MYHRTFMMFMLESIFDHTFNISDIDNSIDVNILSELVNDIEKDNNIPTLEECEICEL